MQRTLRVGTTRQGMLLALVALAVGLAGCHGAAPGGSGAAATSAATKSATGSGATSPAPASRGAPGPAPTPAPATPAGTGSVPLGTNLEGVIDWARSDSFVDLVKQTRSIDAYGSTPIGYDADGWPLGDCQMYLISGGLETAHIYNGTYSVSFVGKGTPELRAVAGSVDHVAYDAATNTTTADVTIAAQESDSGWYFNLGISGTSGGVKDIRVLRPGYPRGTTQVFTTPFLTALGRFGVLRFMDWGSTNGSTLAEWRDRAKATDATQTRVGVAYELMIELCNELKKDCWVNVPHRASDDYVKQLAQLLKAQLDPSLHVYLEYSNEVWNSGFDQAQWNQDAAVAEVQASPGSPLAYDGSTNPGYLAWRRVALRLKQMSDIFASVYGPGSINAVVRPVLAGQVVQPLVAREGLDMIQAVFGPPEQFFYAVAGAPYFDMNGRDTATNLTADDVIAALASSIDAMTNDPALTESAALARYYNLQFLAYEGGADTFGPNNIAAKKAASLDPRMKGLVAKYLDTWFSYGFGDFNWFSSVATDYDSPYGTWGWTNDMTKLDTPKAQGMDAVLAAPRPALAVGTPVPAPVDARSFIGSSQPYADPYLQNLNAGEYRDYLVRAPSDGTYQLRVSAANGNATASTLDVLVNDRKVASLSIPPTSGASPWSTFAFTQTVPITLTAGLDVVRLSVVTDRGYNVQTVEIQ